jgi:hypothetical protein
LKWRATASSRLYCCHKLNGCFRHAAHVARVSRGRRSMGAGSGRSG